MYEKIKALADEAIALQNKTRMEAALREISGICAKAGAMSFDAFEAAELAQHQAARGHVVEMPAGEQLSAGDAVVVVAGKAKKAKGQK